MADVMENDSSKKLMLHITSLENLNDEKAGIGEGITERLKMAKSDGFDTGIIKAIMKRRKAGKGLTALADDLIETYEAMIDRAEPFETALHGVSVTLGKRADG